MATERIFGTGSPKLKYDDTEYIIEHSEVEYNVIDPTQIIQTSIITGKNHIKNKYNFSSLRVYIHVWKYPDYKNKYIFYSNSLNSKYVNIAVHENADYICDVYGNMVNFYVDSVHEFKIKDDKIVLEINFSSINSTRYTPISVLGYGYRYGFAYGLAL